MLRDLRQGTYARGSALQRKARQLIEKHTWECQGAIRQSAQQVSGCKEFCPLIQHKLLPRSGGAQMPFSGINMVLVCCGMMLQKMSEGR